MTNNDVAKFKQKKKNAEIKKIIGIILLILATLAIIGAIFFLYKAFKSRHDEIKAEKDNPTYESLKDNISTENNTVNALNEKLNAQKNSNEIIFSDNGKDYKAVFDPEKNTYSIFEKNEEGIFGTDPTKTITSTSDNDMFTNLQTKLQTQKNSNVLILENGNKAEFNPDTKEWNIYKKTADGFDTTPSQSIIADGDNSSIFTDLQSKLKDQQASNEIIYNKDGKTYKAVYDEETKTYNLFEKNEDGSFTKEPTQTISADWNKDIYNDLQSKLTSQQTSNEIIYTDADGNTYKAVFDTENNTFNLYRESEFTTTTDTTLSYKSLDGREISINNGEQKYVYNEDKDCFDLYQKERNGKFGKYPIDTIKYTSAEEIDKLHNDFPKFLKIGAPILAGGAAIGVGGVITMAYANGESKDIENQEQLSKLNILSKTPATNYYINPQQYNAQPQNINNAAIGQYNTAGVNRYNTGNARGY